MADGSFASLVSRNRDANAVANEIYVGVTDGTDQWLIDGSGNGNVILAPNTGVDIGDVDVTSVIPGVGATNLGKAEDAAHTTGDVGVMALAVRRDADTSLVDTDGDYAPLQVNAIGALKVDVISTVSPSELIDDSAFGIGVDGVNPQGFLADEVTPDSVDEGDIGIARMTLDRKQLGVIVDATVDSQRLEINAAGEAQVDVAAHALTNANALPVSANNAANSAVNPIFVYQTQDVVSSTEVHDYDTAAAVVSDATDNHDYTVTGTTFMLKSVIVAGSGSVKFEIQTGPVLSLATVAVGFLTDRQGDTKQIFFDPAVEVPLASTGTVRVIRTNRQGSATDVYSTIIGNDV